MSQRFPWEAIYELAVLESDPAKIDAYFEAAETLIFARVRGHRELRTNAEADREKQSIDSTLAGLLKIRTEKLGWPGNLSPRVPGS